MEKQNFVSTPHLVHKKIRSKKVETKRSNFRSSVLEAGRSLWWVLYKKQFHSSFRPRFHPHFYMIFPPSVFHPNVPRAEEASIISSLPHQVADQAAAQRPTHTKGQCKAPHHVPFSARNPQTHSISLPPPTK